LLPVTHDQTKPVGRHLVTLSPYGTADPMLCECLFSCPGACSYPTESAAQVVVDRVTLKRLVDQPTYGPLVSLG